MTNEELAAKIDALEGRVGRVETIVDQGTDAGRYTAAVEELAAREGITVEEAVTRFNALLDSL